MPPVALPIGLSNNRTVLCSISRVAARLSSMYHVRVLLTLFALSSLPSRLLLLILLSSYLSSEKSFMSYVTLGLS